LSDRPHNGYAIMRSLHKFRGCNPSRHGGEQTVVICQTDSDRISRKREDAMAGKYVLKKGTTGKFRFNLLSSNGKVIATSEAYETKRAALAGIEAVRKHAAAAKLEDTTVK